MFPFVRHWVAPFVQAFVQHIPELQAPLVQGVIIDWKKHWSASCAQVRRFAQAPTNVNGP